MADDQLKVRGRLEAVGDSIAQLHGCSRLGQVILSTQGHRKERVLGQPSHRPTVPLLLIPTIPLHHSPRQVLLMEQQWWAQHDDFEHCCGECGASPSDVRPAFDITGAYA